MTKLTAEKIDYFYQDGDQRRYVLKDVNVSFEQGNFYTIIGESGSGKTTLLSLLSALDEPKTGKILLDDKDIKAIGFEEFRRNKISIVFQSYNLIPYLTAVENVQVSMAITDNQLPEGQREVAYNLLDYFGITKMKADRVVNQLSGGERQRVAIVRALATNVDFILADEPTGNLDEGMEKEIVGIFKELAEIHNKCVIVVTHSLEIARQSDVSYQLKKGKLKVYE